MNNGATVKNAKVLILGITFKENCPDIRNTRVVDIVDELNEFGCEVHTFDPWANKNEVKKEFHLNLLENIESQAPYSAIILAVGHTKFKTLDFQKIARNNCIIYDVKSFMSEEIVSERL